MSNNKYFYNNPDASLDTILCGTCTTQIPFTQNILMKSSDKNIIFLCRMLSLICQITSIFTHYFIDLLLLSQNSTPYYLLFMLLAIQ